VTDLYALSQHEWEEGVEFEVLPATARLAVAGPTSALLYLVDRAAQVAPSKAVVPGTEWLQIEASTSEGSLPYVRASATDGELTMSTQSDALEVRREGSVLLPAKKLADVLKLAPDPTVSLVVLGNTATVRSGRAQWSLTTPAGDALPPRPDTKGIELEAVPRAPLLHALRAVRLAVSTTAARPALMQALVRNQRITGSDGGRLHQVLLESLPSRFDFTMPVRLIDELIRALRDAGGEFVFLGHDDLRVVATIGDDEIVSQRVMLGYPDAEGLILGPAALNDRSATVNTLELVDAVKRIRVAADPDTATVALEVAPSSKGEWSLTVTALDRNGNSAKEPIRASWQGPNKPQRFVVNHKSLLELLAAAMVVDVTLHAGPDTKTKKYPLLVKTATFTGVLQQAIQLH
jgi:DNA polymerase-3 subunit beta